MRVAPPRWPAWLLARLLPRTLRDAVLGDLEEEFVRRADRDGILAARRWYRSQAMASLRSLAPFSDEPTNLTPPRSPMQGFSADLRFAFRLFSRRPLVTGLALLTMAIGIGATTAIFSVVKPALLDALPYPDAGRLALVWERELSGATSNVGYATYTDLRMGAKSFEEMAAIGGWQPTLLGHGESVRLTGQRVTHRFFRALGVAPALGRDFTEADDQPGVEVVVILGHRLWRDRFGADAAIVGKSISIDGSPMTVVGVLGDDFESVLNSAAEIWRPLRYRDQDWACRTCRHLRVVARLQDAVTMAAATTELSTVMARLKAQFPGDYPSDRVDVEPLKTNVTKGSRAALLTLFAAVALVLMLACVNVANLLLGQAVQRRQEFGVRMALGSGQNRLVRQVLIESGLLGLGGGALALVLTYATAGAIRAALARQIPRADAITVDWQVLVFAAGIGILAGLAFGLLPAFASLEAAGDALRQGARSTGRRAVRRGLVIAEVALASVIVIGAALLVKSMARLLAVDPGFATERLLTADIQLAGPRFRTDSASWSYYRAAREAIGTIPGISRVALTSQLPLGGNLDSYGIHFESKPQPPSQDPSADRFGITPGYFETMEIPLREGRYLAETDRAEAVPVVVVNETLARREFPGTSAIGERIKVGDPAGKWRTIVGVVGDVRHAGLDKPQSLQIYIPTEQWFFAEGQMALVARTAGNPELVARAVHGALRSLDADPTIEQVTPMSAIIGTSTAARRLVLRLFEVFAGLALALAAVGIYGVMSSGVAERTREFGIRAALGAERTVLLRSVLGEAIRLGAIGVGIGILTAMALGPAFRHVLFEVAPTDPTAYLLTGGTLFVVLVIAAWIPARRAAGFDPVEALRAE